jgi:hypothetical protein
MDVEVSEVVGAACGERAPHARLIHRKSQSVPGVGKPFAVFPALVLQLSDYDTAHAAWLSRTRVQTEPARTMGSEQREGGVGLKAASKNER